MRDDLRIADNSCMFPQQEKERKEEQKQKKRKFFFVFLNDKIMKIVYISFFIQKLL